jgi:Na+/melibiose symporter-like transporter
MAASAAINGAVLSATGFCQSTGGTVLDQTPGALRGIAMLLAALPLAFIAAGLFILVFYPINAQKHARIREMLEKQDADSLKEQNT